MNFSSELKNTNTNESAVTSSNNITNNSQGLNMNFATTTTQATNDTLPRQTLDTITSTIDDSKYNCFEIVSGDKFVKNNWMENTTIPTLKALDKHRVAIWLNTDGDYSCRMSPNGEINTMPASKLKKVLSAKLKRSIIISDDHEDTDIRSFDLLLTSADTFDPQCKQEFFMQDGEVYRNKFRPTSYMELDISQLANETKAINRLIDHLVKGNKNYEKWLINWLAYFFQGLKKSPVALFLKGNQGAGNIMLPINRTT